MAFLPRLVRRPSEVVNHHADGCRQIINPMFDSSLTNSNRLFCMLQRAMSPTAKCRDDGLKSAPPNSDLIQVRDVLDSDLPDLTPVDWKLVKISIVLRFNACPATQRWWTWVRTQDREAQTWTQVRHPYTRTSLDSEAPWTWLGKGPARCISAKMQNNLI
jgi:hypothetical protein